MEYVAGENLYKHANSKRMTILQRLDLFLKVCDAVQYLHSHLIVHRDLKPANVLVDAHGNPRVLDFAIAKLLRPELMDGELIIMTKRHPLTAQYASPEQWDGGLITSASDVYSLVVILFELLTGALPRGERCRAGRAPRRRPGRHRFQGIAQGRHRTILHGYSFGG